MISFYKEHDSTYIIFNAVNSSIASVVVSLRYVILVMMVMCPFVHDDGGHHRYVKFFYFCCMIRIPLSCHLFLILSLSLSLTTFAQRKKSSILKYDGEHPVREK